MLNNRVSGWLLVLAFTVMLCPSAGEAQLMPQSSREVSLELRSGVAIPAGDLARGFGVAPSIGMSLHFKMRERVSLRLNQAVDLYTKPLPAISETGMPSLFLFRWNLGGVYHLVPRGGGPLSVEVTGEGGLSALTSERRMVHGEGEPVFVSLGVISPSLGAGTMVGYAISPTSRLFVNVQGLVAFPSTSQTERFPEIHPTLSPIGTVWSFPIMAGLSLHF